MSDERTPTPTFGPVRRAVLDAALRGEGLRTALARRWVARDALLRDAYDRVRRVEALVVDDEIGVVALAQIERALLPEAAESVGRTSETRRSRRRPLTLGFYGGLGAACAALLFLVVLPKGVGVSGDAPNTDVFTARGVAALPQVGVKVRCIDARLDDGNDKSVVAVAEAGPRAPLGALRCPSGSLLGFSVTNLDEASVHLFVVGLAGRDLRWFAPFDAQASSVEIVSGSRDALLPTLADTGTLPVDERTTLYALFSDSPLDARAVRGALDQAARRGTLSAALDRLPVGVPWQARFELTLWRGER